MFLDVMYRLGSEGAQRVSTADGALWPISVGGGGFVGVVPPPKF